MTDEAKITLQIYCIDENGGILAQPRSPVMKGEFEWMRASVWTIVPQDTAYIMAYLQVQEGDGHGQLRRCRTRRASEAPATSTGSQNRAVD